MGTLQSREFLQFWFMTSKYKTCQLVQWNTITSGQSQLEPEYPAIQNREKLLPKSGVPEGESEEMK